MAAFRLPFNPGPTHWSGGARGWFKPTGRAVFVGDRRLLNPPKERWGSRATWGARLFVGLNVGKKQKWKVSDVIAWVKRRWGRGASFVVQQGLWPAEDGSLIPEKAVQVIILNVPSPAGPALTTPRFKSIMKDTAATAARRFRQEEVVLEIQRNGVVRESFGMGWVGR